MTIEKTTPANVAGIQALTSRPAGYAVAAKCVDVQAEAVRRDPGLRAEHAEWLHEDAWSWFQGAVGEIEVGASLDGLGEDWFVRHSVPIGAGTKDVDHLVVGPPGVFAINTKHHYDAKVWIGDYVLQLNGASTHHLAAARRDALDVSRRLAPHVDFTVDVTPVIALVNVRSVRDGRRQMRDISVLKSDDLLCWLRSRPARLSPAQLGLLRLAAEEPETWHVDPNAADTLRAMHRFERLQRAVEAGKASTPPAVELPATPAAESGTKRRAGGGLLVRLLQGSVAVGGALLLLHVYLEVLATAGS
ncbi:nuclease-related domain-containing protein [Desertivibrio insolitus]|uniref:nuclease-related domain-containing protein n=1 Tax=Herbiconiux sp. SYSU D00978 TaxID=2812562 RepID=UPI001A9640AD|nr:nuclease-related domain-containing protein [Herbiconiux sp. SYSU D00978]